MENDLEMEPSWRIGTGSWVCAALVAAAGAAAMAGCARARHVPKGTGITAIGATLTTASGMEESRSASSTSGLPSTTLDARLAAVSYSLDEAEREVLGWLLAEQEPRVEWSRYAGRADVIEAWSANEWGSESALLDFEARTPLSVKELPQVLAVVKASSQSIAALYGPYRLRGASDSDLCSPVGPESRESLIAIFDAGTGRRLASIPAIRRVAQASARFDALVPAAVQPTFSSTDGAVELPTPRAFPTPDPPRLPADAQAISLDSLGALSTELAGQLRAYPLLPGARWEWKETSRMQGVRWSSRNITETVEAVWRVSEDIVWIQSGIEMGVMQGSTRADGAAEPARAYPVWRRLTGRTLLPITENKKSMDWIDPYMRSTLDEIVMNLPPESLLIVEPSLSPFSSFPEFWGPIEWVEVVASLTVAGRPRGDCSLIHIPGGGGWGTYRWFCPEIGYVRSERYSCYGTNVNLTVWELLDFIAPTPAR